jgi:hypothetical protein
VLVNKNLWKITNEIVVQGESSIYEIHSRSTTAFIEKELCFVKYGSSLLYYENKDRIIDIDDSDIEIESQEEYEEWVMKQGKNINPFRKLDKVDLGYLEPEYNEPWNL